MSHTLSFGWRKDKVDNRDRNVRSLLKAIQAPGTLKFDDGIAPSIDLIAGTPTPFDQGPTGSCVGQSVGGAVATRRKLMGMHNPNIKAEAWSRLPAVRWLYYLGRSTHGDEKVDSGTYIREVCRVTSFLGIAPDDVMPWDPNRIHEPPPWSAYRAAYDQRWVKGYYRIFSAGEDRIKDMKRALTAGFPIVFGMDVDKQWSGYTGGTLYPSDMTQILGGHATFLYGYRDNLFLGQNSWGTDWGDGGRYKILPEALCDLHVDDITIIEVPPFDTGTD